jgi:hypothetical protein
MRLLFYVPRPAVFLGIAGLAGLALAGSACGVFISDPARDARLACDRKDGPACFNAANLVVEKNGANAEAIRLYTRGCTVRHSPSCDALSNVKGPLRAQALAEACTAGDVVSCARRAGEFGTDEAGLGEARALRHSVCKMSVNIRSSGTPAREIEGIAESCAALARMIATGQGGGRDDVAAAKLEVLAATLRIEALARHEREDDAKPLPQPGAAAPEEEAPRRKGSKKPAAPKVDPSVAERAKFRREYEARRAAREAWIASVQASQTAAQKEVSRGDPSMPSPTALERAASVLPGAALGASKCQVCVDGCGSVNRCTGDEFAGGRCGQLRCAAGAEACPAFDACVFECTARAEACAKACGECGEQPKAGK